MNTSPSLDIIRLVLNDGGPEDSMRGQRWQDPKIQTRTDVSRPFYFIRPFVPIVTSDGIVRKQKSIPLGFCDELTMRKAQARKQEIMATINGGKFMVQSQIPFSEIAKRFVEARLPQLGTATQLKYRSHIENHILPAFSQLRMCDVDKPTVEAWLAHKADLAWWTRQDLKNILSAIFTKAADWKLWPANENPCTGVEVGRKREAREKKIPKPEDLMRFLAAIGDTKTCPAAHARLMVMIAVVTGCRVSEVLGLQPRDINREVQTITIRRRWLRGDLDVPKTERSKRTRVVGPLAAELLQLAHGKAEDAFLFAGEDGLPPDECNLQRSVFRPTAEAVGIYHPGFGMHEFRRLNISWRQEVGATPFEAMVAAGHSRMATTWDYTVIDTDRERQHVASILDRLTLKPEGPVQ